MELKKTKKAMFFSTDALIALMLILIVLLVFYPIVQYSQRESYLEADVIRVLSTLKVGEINNTYVQNLISTGVITDLNNSILEQIGEFYAVNSPYAEELSKEILSYLDTKDNVGIWFGSDLIASVNTTSIGEASNVKVRRQVISGIRKGNETKGYSTRVFLSKTFAEKHFYFGGYIGNGNISARLDYEGEIKDIDLEVAINNEFDFYINGIFSGHYQESASQFTPAVYDLSAYANETYFNSGSNILEFRGDSLYIGGGYIKIKYESDSAYELDTRYYFPGVEGIINLYDGFYVPGELNELEISLHMDTDYVAFLTIGNVTVFNGSTAGEQTIAISDSQLSSMLDYSELSEKTVPIRFGLEELQTLGGGNADIVLITDLSGSMNWEMDSESSGVDRDCNDPLLYDSSTSRISLAKCLDKEFIDAILNVPGNRVALSAFYGDPGPPNKGRVYEESLTNNTDYLKAKVEGYSPQGGTPICTAINDAYKILNEESNLDRKKFVVVMSDGVPTHACGAANQCDGIRTGLPGDEALWLGSAGCYGGFDDCDVTDCLCASQNAEWSSCRVYNDLGAIVYSIGFGPVSACDMANITLNAISSCGNGKYYSSDNATLLQQFYDSIAQDIIYIAYVEQVSEVLGDVHTILYPDSYIEFDYVQPNVSYGLILTAETDNFDSVSEGILSIESGVEVLEVLAVSYSGPRWTYKVIANGSEAYNLENYGSEFIKLGDPYVVSIPPSLIGVGDNLVRITTAISPTEIRGGSTSDKVIYTIIKPFVSYSEILSTAEGCSWDLTLENNNTMIVNVPLNYSGLNTCFYNPEQTGGCASYHENDAIDVGVYNLLVNLDFDGDCKIDVAFTTQDLSIDSDEITGIPFTWETEVQVRTWY